MIAGEKNKEGIVALEKEHVGQGAVMAPEEECKTVWCSLEREAFRDGWREMGAMSPGIFAWGLVTGMVMVKAGLTVWQAAGMTFLVYAGSAQLTALPLIVAQVPLWIIFATTLAVNLRFLIFAAMTAPHFAHLPWKIRVPQAYFNTDMTMGFFGKRLSPHTLGNHAGKLGYFSGVCYCCWLTWQIGSVLGIVLASQIPEAWQISFTGTVALIALLIPLIVNRAAFAGVVVAGCISVMAVGLPYRLGLVVAGIGGMCAAMMVDRLISVKVKK